MDSEETVFYRLACQILRSVRFLVPRAGREEWLQEWRAELISRRARLRRQDQLTAQKEFELLVRVLGSIPHACWLRRCAWRDQLLIHDFKLAIRALSKQIGFTVVVLTTLILGIGANTVIFTIVDHVLLRPLPYRDSERLYVTVWRNSHDSRITSIPYLDYLDLKAQSEVFEDLALWTWFGGTLRTASDPLSIWGYQVTPNLLDLLGVQPVMGRGFTREESEHSAAVTLLSHQLWQDQFGGDPSLLGQSIFIDDRAYTVVGILPPGFDLEFPRKGAALWVPLDPHHSWTSSRSIYTYYSLGRVAPGVSEKRLETDLATLSSRLQKEFPDTNQDRLYYPVRYLDLVVGASRAELLLLTGAVAIVLLIVCANLANLLLARGLGRRREMALRQALGAGRFQIVRQLLVESLVLFVLGGAGAIIASWALLPALLNLAPDSLPRAGEIRIDLRILLFSLGITLLTATLVALLPALKASGIRLREALQQGDMRVSSAAHWRPVLVAGQIALALTLMAGTGLLIGSLIHVLGQNPGFSTHNRISLEMRLPEGRYPTLPDLLSFLSRLKTELESRPGVESMGVISSLPLSGHNSGSALSIEGEPLLESQLPSVGWQFISPGYLSVMGMQVISGRGFQEQDLARGIHYSLINQTAAERFFPNQNPVGQRIELGVPRGEWHEIIGVVEDVRHLALDQAPEPRVYDLLGQHWGRSFFLVIRGAVAPESLAGSARDTIRDLDPTLPLQNVKSLDELVRASTRPRRFLIEILSFFGVLALLLAAIGIYGVISVWVGQRSRELGVRIALGASKMTLLGLVLKQVFWIAAGGILVGWLVSWAAARTFTNLLFEVRPGDPLTLGSVTLLLLGVVLIAAYLPARRAASIDPLESLRVD